MVKIIDDNAKDGIATIVKDAIHLTGNKGESSGKTIVGETESLYLPNTQPNVSDLIDLNISLIDFNSQLIDVLTGGFVPSVAVGSPPYTPTFLSDLATKKDEVGLIKDNLERLKENLC